MRKYIVIISSISMIIVNQGPPLTWWRHQMETFSALLALCAKNSPVTGEFPSQRPVTRSFGVFFDLCLSKRLSKQSRRRWFQTPSSSLWCHCNVSISNYCESIALVFKHPRVSLQNARNNFGKSLSIFFNLFHPFLFSIILYLSYFLEI